MTKAAATFSLDDLNVRAAHADAFPMPYLLPDGAKSGVVIQVLGSQSEAVQAATSRLLNERRKRDFQAARKGGGVDFTPVEDDVEFGQKAAAARIAGWEGITEPYTPELALKLCQINPDIAAQVMEASNEAGNFTKKPSKA